MADLSQQEPTEAPTKDPVAQPVLGIDIGGSGIKGALVDISRGDLHTDRHRIDTPQPATPEAVGEAVAEIVRHFDYAGAVGVTFPAVVRNGVTHTAANVDDAWIGFHAREHFQDVLGLEVTVLNDADAAGVAEVAFGAGRGLGGTLFVLTFGTGIGSAVFANGELLPNTELGHIQLDGREVEPWASDRARKDEGLSWKKWAKRVDAYLNYLDMLFSPDLFILGGGVSKKSDKFLDKISTRARVVPAELLNEAGIVGAAYAATHRFHDTVQVGAQRRP